MATENPAGATVLQYRLKAKLTVSTRNSILEDLAKENQVSRGSEIFSKNSKI